MARRRRNTGKWYIYALIDPETNETRYIGWTFDVEHRVYDHVWGAGKPRPPGFMDAMRAKITPEVRAKIKATKAQNFATRKGLTV